MPTQTDYLTLSQAVYTIGGTAPVAPSGWTVLTSQSLQSGMQAAAFQNNTTHQIVIAYEGTNLGNLSPSNFSSYLAPQLSADAAIAAGKNPDANKVALAFAHNVLKIASARMAVTMDSGPPPGVGQAVPPRGAALPVSGGFSPSCS